MTGDPLRQLQLLQVPDMLAATRIRVAQEVIRVATARCSSGQTTSTATCASLWRR
jgi:hypothetical protein